MYTARLLDAAEAPIDTAGRRFQPGEPATLRNRAAGKQLVEIFHAAMGMETFIERIVQVTRPDMRIICMTGIEFLQCTHGVPVIV